jgi:competence protein ComK
LQYSGIYFRDFELRRRRGLPSTHLSKGNEKELKDLEVRNYYFINREFIFMTGFYDRRGNQCTLIRDTDGLNLINKSPLEILDESIRCIGFDLRGAMETSKWLLDQSTMCPIMVNPIDRIVLFPIKSHHHEENIWFNPYHIKRTIGIKGETKILFSDGSSLTIPTRLSSYNHKLQNAEQLKKITVEMVNKPYSFVLVPKKKKHKNAVKRLRK